MFGLLHQYLVENRSVYLRGTGQLHLVNQAASFDVANHQLLPPVSRVQLSPNEQAGSLQPLVSFISRQLDVPEENAISIYEAFCNKLQQDLATHSKVSWQNLGEFAKDAVGNTVFNPDERLAQYNLPVTARRIIRANTTHNMMVGTRETTNTAMMELLGEQEPARVQNRWWIAALILGLTAITLIFLKKMQYL
ncbi:MAG: hypothetical protein V4717_04180 [Bacteroidota bacterium]